ncbi:hypothetical protein C0993_010380 [Termitomyces sp. T159_Od127]|nr:hypothetical protein C0993_010380 [Termitomyces sp. T159_Od127]
MALTPSEKNNNALRRGLGAETFKILAEIQGSAGACPDDMNIGTHSNDLDEWEDLSSIPYHRQYCDGLSNAFDIYLSILRIVDARVAQELGRDGENWRVLNACPPCTNLLEDEPTLRFSRPFVLNGNNSLKRVGLPGDQQVGDLRTLEDSDYYISNNFVNRFANEVKKPQPAPSSKPIYSEAEKTTLEFVPDDAGDPTDGTYTFDMVQLGELAKYPLAIIAKCLELLPPGFLLAYDIGCVFDGTIDRSSLGALFKERDCHICVNAFHGYSHNFLCQVQYHPNVIEGMGLEDLETLEWVFSSLNQLASVTRYMSQHRRRVFIDLFFRQWDDAKYVNPANMLYNNYTQALHIINVDGPEIEHAKMQFNVCEGDLEKWKIEEKAYLMTLGKEPEGHGLKIAYIERLREL